MDFALSTSSNLEVSQSFSYPFESLSSPFSSDNFGKGTGFEDTAKCLGLLCDTIDVNVRLCGK